MRFRKLRITWSVMWGTAAVLLIVLWVHSYSGGDSLWVRYSATGDVLIMSTYRGSVVFKPTLDPTTTFFYIERNPTRGEEPTDDGREPNSLWFQSLTWSGSTYTFVPMWFVFLITLATSSAA